MVRSSSLSGFFASHNMMKFVAAMAPIIGLLSMAEGAPQASCLHPSAMPSTGVRESSSPLMENKKIEVIEPGLVILRGFVDDDACRRIARMAKVTGSVDRREDGFYSVCPASGQRTLNTGEARGRLYDRAERFAPFGVLPRAAAAVAAARRADPAMPPMACSHVLLNMYVSSEGLAWHRDIYENDGRSDRPVVNLSVGAACVFGFKHRDTDEERTVTLRSGDVLLFGGPCRLIKHAVLDVDLRDCPAWMAADPCRFSFTFRDSPEVLGREEEFRYFRVKEHLLGQEEFEAGTADAKSYVRRPALPTQRASQRNLSTVNMQ